MLRIIATSATPSAKQAEKALPIKCITVGQYLFNNNKTAQTAKTIQNISNSLSTDHIPIRLKIIIKLPTCL